jgi:hypothetical protein
MMLREKGGPPRKKIALGARGFFIRRFRGTLPQMIKERGSMKKFQWLGSLGLAMALGAAHLSASAQDNPGSFDREVDYKEVIHKAPGARTKGEEEERDIKYFEKKNMLRVESTSFGESHGETIISDLSKGKMYILFPSIKSYTVVDINPSPEATPRVRPNMDSSMDLQTNNFSTVKKALTPTGKKDVIEVHNGGEGKNDVVTKHHVKEWKLKNKKGEIHFWMDEKAGPLPAPTPLPGQSNFAVRALTGVTTGGNGFPLKIENDSDQSEMVAVTIKDQAQTAVTTMGTAMKGGNGPDLFKIPADYKEYTPAGLSEAGNGPITIENPVMVNEYGIPVTIKGPVTPIP